MDEYIGQVVDMQNQHDYCPILIAGDIFHKADNPAELINFLLRRIPDDVYGIPGQHDLPMHSYEDIKKSSYWTLVEAGKIKNLEPGPNHIKEDIVVYAFPWGHKVTNPDPGDKTKLKVCLAHTYVWWKDNKFKGAPKEKNILNMESRLDGYKFAVFGDNHKGFYLMSEHPDDPWILNCGAFIRRRMDEIHYEPQIGLLHAQGNITIHKLDTQSDVFIDVDEALEVIEHAADAVDLLEALARSGTKVVEFVEAVKQFCEKNNVGKGVRAILSEVLKDE